MIKLNTNSMEGEMSFFINILQVVLLLVCIFGFSTTLNHRFNVRLQYSGICAVSLISVFMIIMGILNTMLIGCIILYILGVLLFLSNLIKNKIEKKNLYYYVLSLVLISFFYYKLLHVEVYSYDAFSHWGLVIRLMQSRDMIPRFDDWIIGFSDYPIGLSIFSYFGSIIDKFSENLYSQTYAIVYVFAMISIIPFDDKDKNTFSKMFIYTFILIFFTVYINTVNVPVSSLYVDTILSIVASSLVFMVYVYKNNIEEIYIPFALLSSFLISIKHSGSYFVIVSALMYICYTIKSKKFGKKQILSIISPFMVDFIWNRHFKYAFYSLSGAKHSMSIDRYAKELSEKGEKVNTIIEKFINANIHDMYWYIFLGLVIVSIAFYFLMKKEKYKKVSKFLALIFICTVIYQLLNMAMYVFSMPINEALHLAGYERYALTIKIFSFVAILSYLMREAFSFSKLEKSAMLIVFILFAVFKGNVFIDSVTKNIDYTNDKIYDIKSSSLKNFNQIDYFNPSKNKGKKFLIFDDKGYSYEGFLVYKYILLNSDIQIRGIDDYGKVDNSDFDVVLINSNTINKNKLK